MHLVSINTAKHANYLESNNIEPFIFFSGIVATFMLRCFSLKENIISYPKENQTGIDFYPLKIQLLPSLTFIELLGNIAKQYQQDCDHQRATQEIAMDFYPNVSVIDKKTWSSYTESIEHTSDILTFIYDLDAQAYSIYCDSDYIPAYFAKYFEKLIDSVISEANSNLSDYALISQSERHKMLYEWNNTDKPYPTDITIHELFQQQAQKTPDNIAVVHHDQQLTYQQLNEQSNQLARYIRKKYCEKKKKSLMPDTLIAIYMEKSIDMIVAILGILKAGGAYVPIDPSYPKDRVHYIMEDAQADLVLTQTSLKMQLTTQIIEVIHQPNVLTLDNKPYAHEKTFNLDVHSKAQDLSYVIYTSGTTGQPKGVMIEHHSLVNLVFNQQQLLNLNETDRVLQFGSIAFDMSVWETFGTLAFGARLLMFDMSITNIVPCMTKHKITVATFTPQLLMRLPLKKVESLNTVIVAAEACPKSLMLDIISQNKWIINAYGPTENTVCGTVKLHQQKDINTNIGTPLHNMKSYVLDQMLNPVPIGVIGELYLGGAGLARGYLNKPQLTNERFLGNPFFSSTDWQRGYRRLYKTGDLVRQLPNGDMEYIGRNDSQVKIRGYRIELNEVQTALNAIDTIEISVVLVQHRKNKVKDKQLLTAYYVSNKPIPIGELRKELLTKLPHYMLPQQFIHLKQLPVTINGKLDQKALLCQGK
ncbi:non-ribosomal peptide synthetase [Cysteiniphilum litorale]|uniref:non-ribosomal peptide synthetase n=1 Tax=Cysteiniphilum litorale TaxID=2056700 RepID=UPI003F884F17